MDFEFGYMSKIFEDSFFLEENNGQLHKKHSKYMNVTLDTDQERITCTLYTHLLEGKSSSFLMLTRFSKDGNFILKPGKRLTQIHLM